jgi:Cu-processing system permease protein
MSAVTIIAAREIKNALRNRWVIAATVVLGAFALSLAFLGSAPTGTVAASPLAVTAVSLSSLTIFLVPLIALLLSYDAVLGEIDRGTMALLLTYPVARWEVIAGKFFGHVAVLTFATLVGYGAAGLALWVTSEQPDPEAWWTFARMIGSSVLLGASFIAIGYLVNTLVHDRGTAAGIAVGVWLLFVLVYDTALLGSLVADQGRYMSPDVLNWILLLNPADAYRLFNLAGFSDVSSLTGLAGLSDQIRIEPEIMLVSLLLWAAVPLLLSILLFARRSV